MFGHMGERLRHLGAFPKCLGKKPSHPPARAGLRDFREEEFPSSLREVPLVWDVHQKIPNEIQCAPSDEIKLAGQVCPPNQGKGQSPNRANAAGSQDPRSRTWLRNTLQRLCAALRDIPSADATFPQSPHVIHN